MQVLNKSWPWREGKKERVHFSAKPRGERLGEREKRRQRQKERIQRLAKREREMGGGGGGGEGERMSAVQRQSKRKPEAIGEERRKRNKRCISSE